MTRRQKRTLWRILTGGVLFFACLLVFYFVAAPWWAELLSYIAVYLLVGYDVLFKAARNLSRGRIFDENFLMIVATVGAFCVREYPEAAAVMLFYQTGELFQSVAVGRSRRSIASLMDIRPDAARVLRDGEQTVVHPSEVEVGETIVVLPGEKIALDGTVVFGESMLGTAALTGESVPVAVRTGEKVLSGSVNQSGVLHVRVEKPFAESTASKILELVENASSKKAKAENFITKFAKVYTPAVVAVAAVLAVVPSLVTGDWAEWIHRALVFLVVSCPCALVISVPLGFFGGIGAASSQGVLIKGGNYVELLSDLNTVLFDKTGTLTRGVFEVQEVLPQADADRVLRLAAIAEKGSLHPIAQSILAAAPPSPDEGYGVTEAAGKGVIARKNGDTILVGNEKLMRDHGVDFPPCDRFGTLVFVAHNGAYVGTVVIADAVKPDAPDVIGQMHREGMRTVMLTGDNAAAAAAVAQKTGINEYAAALLPEGKVQKLEEVLMSKRKGEVVAFAGDGINDAPVLARADLGIAMGALGSDAAIEAADVVLMRDSLSAVLTAKRIAKKTMRIVRQNIVFSLLVKAAVLILSALGLSNMWLAVFADVGVAVLAILNAARVIAFGRSIPKKDKQSRKN